MKVERRKTNTQVAAVGEVIRCRVEMTPEMFDMMSSEIYSDKVLAIVRELANNAADSHAEAGKPLEPVTVHLPNELEPWLTVKDTGIGLSDEKMRETFTAYFKSDKRETNDLAGCHGLGSKSPFAYAEQTNITSVYNGKKSVWTGYIDEEGFPTVMKREEWDTDEPNGVEIQVPVARADFREFERKAKRAYQWFEVKPILEGVTDTTISDPGPYLLQTPDYGVYEHDSNNGYYHTYDSHVVMGNNAYRVGSDDLDDTQFEFTKMEKKLLQWGVDLYVPMGTINIALNREVPSYRPETVKAIKEALSKVVEGLKEDIQKQIDDCKSLWEARLFVVRLVGKDLFKGIADFEEGVFWKGHRLENKIDIPTSMCGEVVELTTSNRRRSSGNKKLSRYSTGHVLFSANHDPDETPVFFIRDVNRGSISAMHRYMGENEIKRSYAFTSIAKGFLAASGIAPEWFVYTSTIPKPESEKRAYVKKEKAVLNEWQSGTRYDKWDRSMCDPLADGWVNSDCELSEGGVYIDVHRWRTRIDDTKEWTHPGTLNETMRWLRDLGSTEPLFGVRPADKEKMDRYPGKWLHLVDYVQKIVAENKSAIEKQIKLGYGWRNFKSKASNDAIPKNWYARFFEFDFAPDSTFGIFLKELKESNEAHHSIPFDRIRAYEDLKKEYGIAGSLPQGTTISDKDVITIYPLITKIDSYGLWRESDEQAFVDYVKMMDIKMREAELSAAASVKTA